MKNLLTQLKDALSPARKKQLRRVLRGPFPGQHWLYRILWGGNLKALAQRYGSDKWGGHRYAEHYATHFSEIRLKKLNVLEIGIGGYANPAEGGESLRMWRTYFPHSKIFGVDIVDKSKHNATRIQTFRGSQADSAFLESVVSAMGGVDIAIDDGSHQNQHVLATFHTLFPMLNVGGWYVIEDTQTSYWKHMGGSSTDLDRRDTTIGYMKTLADSLNYEELECEHYSPTYYDKHVVAVHFYHNMVFIRKGSASEGSNVLGKRW